VHGHALGGGCELTMVCDLVVADETARFGTPEAGVGLFPGPGVVRGRANLTLHMLKYMIFTGSALDARQALAAGLVNEVVPAGQHLAKAEEWAARIAEKSPLALASAKALLGAEGWERYPHVVDAIAMLQGSDDFAEGIAAFGERRPPSFEGR
jgi:enoyl-CoA hydratase/carnithine racemase